LLDSLLQEMSNNTTDENRSTSLFREYIRIKTVQPHPDYPKCMEFLKTQANSLGLPYRITECVPGKPIFVMTWSGTDPSSPSIMLNSHTDVVPVFPEHWKYEPFSAEKESNGDIYGRGTQDMKCVGIQHLEAVRKLKEAGNKFKRTIHLTFVPEEEVGGVDGMQKWVHTEHFKSLNVGFGLDEGLASEDEEIPAYYGERNVFWLIVTCPGNPGHGSRFVENTPGEKAQYMINRLMEYRESEKKRLEANPDFTLGDVTSVNLTIMEGGVQHNVVPDKFVLKFDIRITPTTNLKEFEAKLRGWADEAGPGIEFSYAQKFTDQTMTSVAVDDPWWAALTAAFNKHNLNVKPQIFPAGTDSRFLREVGIPAIGFSPMNHHPVLLHDHNEYLNEATFLRGIDIFEDMIANIANV